MCSEDRKADMALTTALIQLPLKMADIDLR